MTDVGDPAAAVRPCLREIVSGPGADGIVPIDHLLRLAHAWLDADLPVGHGAFLAEHGRSVRGSGTSTDPWRLDVAPGGLVQVCLWAGPEGPALPDLPAVSGGDRDVVAGLFTRARRGVSELDALLAG